MESYIVEVLNLVFRWLHIIAGIAWVGASFYFVMLDASLRAPDRKSDKERGVSGELWSVHGGGIYLSQKFISGPSGEVLSDNLHWSKWEAYTTWLSGIGLLAIVYWYGAEIYLIDPQVFSMSQTAAITISVSVLVFSWLIYDWLCRSSIAENGNVLTLLICVLVSTAAWGLCQVYSGRGAYIMFGAMLGTIMAGNVFFAIIPNQKKLVDTIRNEKTLDSSFGASGKQRSVHNTYFTLPVLFTMISNHYAVTYGHEYNWLVLIFISLAGALIRVFFVSRHSEGRPVYLAAVAALVLLLVAFFISMPPQKARSETLQVNSSDGALVSFSAIQSIITERCASCHSVSPTQPGFASAPKGIVYDTSEQIRAQKQLIYQQAVVSKAMPIGNLTGMTDAERLQLEHWFNQKP